MPFVLCPQCAAKLCHQASQREQQCLGRGDFRRQVHARVETFLWPVSGQGVGFTAQQLIQVIYQARSQAPRQRLARQAQHLANAAETHASQCLVALRTGFQLFQGQRADVFADFTREGNVHVAAGGDTRGGRRGC